MKWGYWFGIGLLVLVGCAAPQETVVVPTLIDLPSPTATATITSVPSVTAVPPTQIPPTQVPPTQVPPTPVPPTSTATPIPETPTNTPVPLTMLIVDSQIGSTVRSGPGDEYDLVGEVLYGERLGLLGQNINPNGSVWYMVQMPDGLAVWIAGDAIRFEDGQASPPTPIATLPQGTNAVVSGGQGANLRTGAGYGFSVLQLLEQGTPLVMIGRTDTAEWYEVVVMDENARLGWILADLVDTSVSVQEMTITWEGPPAITQLECGINIQPRDGHGWPSVLPSMPQWVRFPLTSSLRHFPTLEAALAYFDPIINTYNARGAKVLLVLTHESYGEASGWAWNSMTSQSWSAFTQPFVAMVERITAHFGNRVAGYEIWNEGDAEANNPAAVRIPPTAYAPLLDASARAIRRNAPRAYVVLGGLLTSDALYLRQVRDALGGEIPVDAIAIHPYGLGAPGNTSVFSRLGSIETMIDNYGRVAPNIPLWITEAGALGDNAAGRWGEVSSYISSLVSYLRASGRVETFIWYAWSDAMHPEQSINGLVTTFGQPKQPIYDTFYSICG